MTWLAAPSPSILLQKRHWRKSSMLNRYVQLALLGAGLLAHAATSYGAPTNAKHQSLQDSSAQQVNPVVQWNRALLVIVRTPGAQSPTIHPTRSFAIMHAAIYDAVNSIDRTHKPYLVRVSGVPQSASQDAAAAVAAHDVLAALYPNPNFQAMLDAQLQQSLAPIAEGGDKASG